MPCRPAHPVLESANVSDMSESQGPVQLLDLQVQQFGALLSELGWDRTFKRWATELPDMRDRLGHVAQMTDAAANKVLNLIDDAQPECDVIVTQSSELALRLAQLADHNELGVGEARAALAEAAAVLKHQGEAARRQSQVLGQIMLAQDFQDLSGQVIKKVVGIVSRAEQQLQRVLTQSQRDLPDSTRAASALARLEGPQLSEKAVAQDDVDDLLASLGF